VKTKFKRFERRTNSETNHYTKEPKFSAAASNRLPNTNDSVDPIAILIGGKKFKTKFEIIFRQRTQKNK
jgi:hypothetical protein